MACSFSLYLVCYVFGEIFEELCTVSSSDGYEDSRHFRGIPSNRHPNQPCSACWADVWSGVSSCMCFASFIFICIYTLHIYKYVRACVCVVWSFSKNNVLVRRLKSKIFFEICSFFVVENIPVHESTLASENQQCLSFLPSSFPLFLLFFLPPTFYFLRYLELELRDSSTSVYLCELYDF